jgi:simple sugar transport system permease protein
VTARIRSALAAFGLARGLIAAFALALFLAAIFHEEMNFPFLVGQSLRRVGMNAILVLAMLPTIRSGSGPNFGLPVGIIAGIFGCVVALQYDLTGAAGLATALVVGVALAVPLGILYGLLLNSVRGSEMIVGLYVGFSAVALGSIFWALAPFDNTVIVWPLKGSGLRTTLQLRETFGAVLDDYGRFECLGVSVPTGLVAFVAACYILVWAFFKTRLGLAMIAAGSNPSFARASGINPPRMRIVGAVLSTVLGAIGIVVYAQSFGFVQLYYAPLFMALPAVAAVLIGGASLSRASVAHVVLGVILFQTILTLSMPATNAIIGGDMSETLRLGIQNGMILYALTRQEGGR